MRVLYRHWETSWEDEIQGWAVKPKDTPQDAQPPVILDDHFVILLPPTTPIFGSDAGQDLCPCTHTPEWDPAQAQQLRITVRNTRNRTDFRITSQGQCLPAKAVLVNELPSHSPEVDIATFDVRGF